MTTEGIRYECEPIVIRERERNSSPMSVTKHRSGPRYQGGGLILNESQRKEDSRKDSLQSLFHSRRKKERRPHLL